jgi:MATE family multidrug resistance protein
MVETINMIMIGQLNDPIKLAGVGMGNMFINMCGVGPYYGLNSALETLVSQAKGANNIELCGVYLQRGRVMAIIFFIPVCIMFVSSGFIINAFG